MPANRGLSKNTKQPLTEKAYIFPNTPQAPWALGVPFFHKQF
jgi:hypothetical protein